jgi:hypothetical protein
MLPFGPGEDAVPVPAFAVVLVVAAEAERGPVVTPTLSPPTRLISVPPGRPDVAG